MALAFSNVGDAFYDTSNICFNLTSNTSNSTGSIFIEQSPASSYCSSVWYNTPLNSNINFNYFQQIGDDTSNIAVHFNNSNLSLIACGSNVGISNINNVVRFNTSNNIITNIVNDILYVKINTSNVFRVNEPSLIPSTYNNTPLVIITASNTLNSSNFIHIVKDPIVQNNLGITTHTLFNSNVNILGKLYASSFTASNVSFVNPLSNISALNIISSNLTSSNISARVASFSNTITSNLLIGTNNSVANFDVFGNHTALRNINTAIIAKNGRIGIADSTSVRLHVTFSNFASGKFIVNTVRAVPGQEQTFYAEYDINYLSNLTPIIVSAKIGQSGGSHRINYTEWFFDSINRNLTYVVGRLAGSTIDFGLQAIGRFPDFQITKSAILPSGELLSNYQTHLNSNGNFGIGVQNATTTLDVNGTINASNYTGQTITDLSNLGIFSSNTSVSASNTTISLSNYVYGSNTTNITSAQTTANFASNTSIWTSNNLSSAFSASNNTFTISNELYPRANFASNTSTWASNNLVNASNQLYPRANFASNTAVWSSNNIVSGASASNNTFTISNQLYPMASFASNTSVSASNTTISLSNYVYGTNTTNITNAQTTANFASNLSIYSSNYINITLPNDGLTFNSNAGINIKDNNSLAHAILYLNSNNNTFLTQPTSGFAMFINPFQTDPLYLNYRNTGGVRIYNSNDIIFRTSGLNVGIGTNNTPIYPLDVNGTIRCRSNVLINSNNELEFGLGITKENNAGKIGYQRFSDSLDIVGAGTNNTNRKVRIYEHLDVGNSITTPNITATTAITAPSITATNSLTIGTSTIKGIFTGSATIPGSGGGSAITMTVTHNWNLTSGNFTYLLTHIDTTTPVAAEVFAFKVLSASPNSIDIYVARVDSFNAWTQTHTLQYSIVVS